MPTAHDGGTQHRLTLRSCAVAGPRGEKGTSAYQAAVAGGFSGSEELFNGTLAGLKWTTPEAYGAKGDGTTDDTAAFQQALDAGGVILANNQYLVSMVTVKNAALRIHGTILGTVRLSNNATIEGGTIQQTSGEPCVIVESTAAAGTGYLNGTLRSCNLKPSGAGVGIKILAVTNPLFGFLIENVDIESTGKAIWVYNEKWITKGDIRNVFCHSPSRVIVLENTLASRSYCGDITLSNVYAQYYSGKPVHFLEIPDKSVDVTLYDSFVYDGIGDVHYSLGQNVNDAKITLLGRCINPNSDNFTDAPSLQFFWFDSTSGTVDPHLLKASARRNLPTDNFGLLAPEAFTGGPSVRFIGFVGRAGRNFGGGIHNHVFGISFYNGRLVLLRSTDGKVEDGSYIELTSPFSGAVYDSASLPTDALNGAKCWCSDLKMDVTFYNGIWYKPDGTALTAI